MILKFKTGRGARGLLEYMASGAGQVAPMFTNMAGQTPRELAREVAALRSLRPNLGKAAAHLILAHDPSQRTLSEDEWRESLELALKEHRAGNAPYAAYMHTDAAGPHLHVFFCGLMPQARRSVTAVRIAPTSEPPAPLSSALSLMRRLHAPPKTVTRAPAASKPSAAGAGSSALPHPFPPPIKPPRKESA